MSSLRRSIFSASIIAAFGVLSVGAAFCQTTELKPKPTGTVSGRIVLNEKPLPGIVVAAYSEPETRKKEIALKPCEQQSDLDLPYLPSTEVKP